MDDPAMDRLPLQCYACVCAQSVGERLVLHRVKQMHIYSASDATRWFSLHVRRVIGTKLPGTAAVHIALAEWLC